jgi:hypothetical protein
MSENKESKMIKTTCACYPISWVERPVECTCLCTWRKTSNFSDFALVAAPPALVVNPTCLCKPCLYGLPYEFYCLKNKKGCVCENDVYLLIGVMCDNITHFCTCDQDPARPRICEHDDDVKCGTDISKGNCENIPIKRVCLYEEKEYRPHKCSCRPNFDNPACLRVDNTPFHLTLSARRKTKILSALDLLNPESEIADPVNIAGLIAGFL